MLPPQALKLTSRCLLFTSPHYFLLLLVWHALLLPCTASSSLACLLPSLLLPALLCAMCNSGLHSTSYALSNCLSVTLPLCLEPHACLLPSLMMPLLPSRALFSAFASLCPAWRCHGLSGCASHIHCYTRYCTTYLHLLFCLFTTNSAH